ncbi:mycofactocin-associated electron transfer flavoprotein beta subunit [Streptomyces sp. NPDC048254]|uniref:mycofactocin-associated electron transfer flavoprotein beta subunit n=1 Tax=Streptomyces sp. NPDC048254 TaxID=3365525 RepID=UPI00372256A2
MPVETVLVCVRPAEPASDVDPLSGAVSHRAGNPVLTDADAAALEYGLRLADAWSARVHVIGIGGPEIEEALRIAAALGAATVRVEAPEAADPTADDHARAQAIASAARPLSSVRLVLCGDGSADGGTGALPAFLAHELGAAQALGLTRLELREADGALVGERRLDGGRREVLRVPPGAVCSVEAAGVRLRRAALPAVLRAARAPVESIASADGRTSSTGTVTAGPPRPARPRTRVVAPPDGTAPRDRLRALTGVQAPHHAPESIGPVDAVKAADALLDFLRERGYLDASALADTPRDTPR